MEKDDDKIELKVCFKMVCASVKGTPAKIAEFFGRPDVQKAVVALGVVGAATFDVVSGGRISKPLGKILGRGLS